MITQTGIEAELIYHQAAIDALDKRFDSIPMEQTTEICLLRKDLRQLPSALLGTNLAEVGTDCISRQAAIDAINEIIRMEHSLRPKVYVAKDAIKKLPSAQPEQRYTEEELRVFQHGISLSLLSKRSAQHWHYDEDMATEIKFLERLYEKVSADMRGEQDG